MNKDEKSKEEKRKKKMEKRLRQKKRREERERLEREKLEEDCREIFERIGVDDLDDFYKSLENNTCFDAIRSSDDFRALYDK